MDDAILIELYWKRDENAITQTKLKYGGYCRKIAQNILKNIQDIEECENDTYLKVWKSIPEDKPNIFSAYLAKIIRNLSINMYNKATAQKHGGGELELILDELENCIPTAQSVEIQLEQKEITEAINTFLFSLEIEQRVIFVRRYWYADSIKAIAERLEFSESKIKSILFRVRNKLKRFLEKEGISF